MFDGKVGPHLCWAVRGVPCLPPKQPLTQQCRRGSRCAGLPTSPRITNVDLVNFLFSSPELKARRGKYKS